MSLLFIEWGWKRAEFFLCRGALLICASVGSAYDLALNTWKTTVISETSEILWDGSTVVHTKVQWGLPLWRSVTFLKWFNFERGVFWVVHMWEVDLWVKLTWSSRCLPWKWSLDLDCSDYSGSPEFLFAANWVAVELTRRRRASKCGTNVLRSLPWSSRLSELQEAIQWTVLTTIVEWLCRLQVWWSMLWSMFELYVLHEKRIEAGSLYGALLCMDWSLVMWSEYNSVVGWNYV